MKIFSFQYRPRPTKYAHRIIALDTEWAKNWRAVEKLKPFCSSLHCIYIDDDIPAASLEDLPMESLHCFRQKGDLAEDYAQQLDMMLSQYRGGNTTIVGHQISSDLSTLMRSSRGHLSSLQDLSIAFRNRKSPSMPSDFRVADTRYDIRSRLRGNGAEKLRNVSLRLGIFAVQYELDQMSLTKMYNTFDEDGDNSKMEKLLVMNWRHAFQTALVWLVDAGFVARPMIARKRLGYLTTNEIIRSMGQREIEYLTSKEYDFTCTLEGIRKYVSKYSAEAGISPIVIAEST